MAAIGAVAPGPKRMYDGVICSFEGCGRPSVAKGLCNTHREHLRRYGEPRPIGWRPPRVIKTCEADGCDRRQVKLALCQTHYRQWWRSRQIQPIRQSPGRRVDPVDGYVYLKRPDSPEAHKSGWGFEHRIIMADILDRPLWPDENVHHKNGIRDDNRLENLELWSRAQPKGQRVEDKLAWAEEFLRRYRPELFVK